MKNWSGTLFAVVAAVAVGGCIVMFIQSRGTAYRVRLGDGSVAQCASLTHRDCGISLTDCVNAHQYHCVHSVDVELVAANAPVPQPTPPPPPPAPPPTVQPSQAPAK